MLTREQNLACFHAHAAAADIAIVDGTMGLFDGWDGRSEDGSTAQMAKWLKAPVLLVLDCWTLARSAGAMVKGYADLDPDLSLAGLLLNNVGSDAHKHWLKDAIHAAGVAAPVLAAIPKVHQTHSCRPHGGLFHSGIRLLPASGPWCMFHSIKSPPEELISSARRTNASHLQKGRPILQYSRI